MSGVHPLGTIQPAGARVQLGHAGATTVAQSPDGSHSDADATATAALQRLRARGQVLADLAAALSLDRSALAYGETPDRLEVIHRVGVERLASDLPAALAAAFLALGTDLTLDLMAVGGNPDGAAPLAVTLEASASGPRGPVDTLASFLARLARLAASSGEQIEVECRLRAEKALARADALGLVMSDAGDHGGVERLPVVFYTSGGWEALLSVEAVPLLARTIFALPEPIDAASPEVPGVPLAVLCDAAGYLAGPVLDVVGAASPEPPRWLPRSRASVRRFAERADEMRRLCAEEGGWGTRLPSLTPAHLRVEKRAPGMRSVAAQLDALAAVLATGYLASSVHGSFEEGLRASFGAVRPRLCWLSGDATSDARIDLDTPPETETASVVRLAAWAYAHASQDKLAIARECLDRALPPERTIPLASVERAAAQALDAAKANFALYLRGKTRDYFAVRQSAFDAIAAYGESVRSAARDLAAGAVDTTAKAAGVALGALIAVVVQPAASRGVLCLAALLYAAYLVVGIAFVLRSRYDQLRLERDDLLARLAALPELTATERATLQSPLARADAHAARYLCGAAMVYAGLLLAALALAALTIADPALFVAFGQTGHTH